MRQRFYRLSYHRTLLEEQIRSHAELVQGRVLEVGSGSRRYDHLFEAEITAIDMKPNLEKDILPGDMHGIEFPDESFDSVISFEVLCYSSDHRRALAEMFRVIKPGGRLLVSVPFFAPDVNDNMRFTATYMEKLLSEYPCSERRVVAFGNPVTVMWDLLRHFATSRSLGISRGVCKLACLPFLLMIKALDLGARRDTKRYSGIFVVARKARGVEMGKG